MPFEPAGFDRFRSVLYLARKRVGGNSVMQTRILVALLYGWAGAGAVVAETIVIDDQVQLRESSIDRPKRGITMDQVEARYGAPVTRHPTIGEPPITRWDYPSFSVFFEHDRVIHSVARGG
jgi:hypothetical protein